MRVIIAGSRPPKAIRDDPQRLEQWYEEHYDVLEEAIEHSGMRELIEVVVGGETTGYDELGKRWAHANGLEYEPHAAKWRNKQGVLDMGAGMKRNREMAQSGIDGAVILWDGKSSGARNCIVECEKVAKAGGMELECIWVELVDA